MLNYKFQWAEENYNYYELESILLNYGIRSKNRWGQGINNGITFGKNFHAEFYLPEEDLKIEAENWHKFLMNKKKFESFIQAIQLSTKDMLNEINKLVSIDLSKLNNEELWDIYDLYGMKIGKLMNCYIVSQPHRVVKLEKELLSFLEKKNVDDLGHYFSVLTSSPKKFVFLKEGNKFFNSSFFELLGKENSSIDKSLIKKRMYIEKVNSNPEKKRIISILNPSLKIKRIINILSSLGYERFKMRFVWMPALYYNEMFLIEFKKRFNITKSDLRAYDFPEIEKLIKFGKKLDLQKMEIRKKGFLKHLIQGKILTYEGEKAQQVLNKLIQTKKEAKELTGMVASKGHAVGKVIILSYRNSEDHSAKIKKMEKGDIIITEMTRPNIIPACENAGAIITDEGGILCHAAIVSRELGVPCVIGTKEATSSFKDGDFVEVDAIKGKVKKITFKEYQDKKHNNILKVKCKVIKKTIKENKLKIGNLFWFKEIGIKDIPTVGGKGASLGELYKIVNVPNGFCISVNAYANFLKENKLNLKITELLKNLDITNHKELEEKSNKIRELIINKEISLNIKKEIVEAYKELNCSKVAVRSSATAEDLPSASFAGQQDTYLNISSEEELINSVKKCWASLFTSRAIYYRKKNNFPYTKVFISVVVQKMVDADYAGVLFTKDPIEKKYILIEVVKGLGEQLVSGEVTPNTYHLEKKKLTLIKRKENFSFNLRLLTDLSKIGNLIESHYKFPQDIEWAIDKNGRIFILQSRAITTL